MDTLEEARKVVALRGDTYSSYEVVGLVGRLADEIERLRAALEAIITLETCGYTGGLADIARRTLEQSAKEKDPPSRS